MNGVFLDTVGLLALWDVADQWHPAARQAFAALTARRVPLITTTFVLLECGNAAARRPYRQQAALPRDMLERRNELITPDTADWNAAWEAYRRGDAAQAGIVDHASFNVMRRLGVSEAFTNDRHFAAAGFVTLF